MEIVLDIPLVTKPIIRKTLNIELKKTTQLKEKKIELDHRLNDLILLVEGFYKFIPELSSETIKDMLPKAKEAVSKMTEVENHRQKIHFLNDTIFKEKFQYALKSLYKLHSLLHIAYYKNKAVLKTEENIRTGLSKISLEAVSSKIIAN